MDGLFSEADCLPGSPFKIHSSDLKTLFYASKVIFLPQPRIRFGLQSEMKSLWIVWRRI